MQPMEVPPGTTIHSLFTKVLPATHAKLVPAGSSSEPLVTVFRLEGGPSYTLIIRGKEVDVTQGEAANVALWVATSVASVERILTDWTGPQRFLPKAMPQGALAFSDPRVVRRLMMVTGRIELALSDFSDSAGQARLSMIVGAGEAARKGIVTEDPDAVVEVRTSTVEQILSARLTPEQALADGHVTLRGKRLVAMQFALALAPVFPPRP